MYTLLNAYISMDFTFSISDNGKGLFRQNPIARIAGAGDAFPDDVAAVEEVAERTFDGGAGDVRKRVSLPLG